MNRRKQRLANLTDDTNDAPELLSSIELGTDQTDNFSKMVNMVADYFIYQGRVNMGLEDRKIFREEFETKAGSSTSRWSRKGLRFRPEEHVSGQQRFVAPLEDLEALLPQASENDESETSESVVD